MSEKHTPGPWEFDDKNSSGFPLLCLYAADNRNPFHGSRSDAEMNANARLIAAAPDLLDALRNTASMLRSACLAITDTEARQMALETVAEANTAIAKATGVKA